MTENDKDVELLLTNPTRLIVKYQTIVEVVVKKYIASGMFAASDLDDIVQSVNESLLARLPAIQRHYNRTALFKTYLSVIIKNICLKLYRRSRKQERTIELVESVHGDPQEFPDRYSIDHAVSRFRVIIDLYHSQKPRVLLCLKLYFRIPVVAQDIRSLYPRCSPADLRFLLSSFGESYDTMKESRMYEIITPIMNKYEKKSNSPDALRKWTQSKAQGIIRILNGQPQMFNFDKETLQILVENHFSPFLQMQ